MCGSVMHFSACFCGNYILVRHFDCKDLRQLQTLLKTFSDPLLCVCSNSDYFYIHSAFNMSLYLIMICILLGQVTLTVAIYIVYVCIVILSASDAAHCSLWIALVLLDQVMEELRSAIPCCQKNTGFTILKFMDIKGHAA